MQRANQLLLRSLRACDALGVRRALARGADAVGRGEGESALWWLALLVDAHARGPGHVFADAQHRATRGVEHARVRDDARRGHQHAAVVDHHPRCVKDREAHRPGHHHLARRRVRAMVEPEPDAQGAERYEWIEADARVLRVRQGGLPQQGRRRSTRVAQLAVAVGRHGAHQARADYGHPRPSVGVAEGEQLRVGPAESAELHNRSGGRRLQHAVHVELVLERAQHDVQPGLIGHTLVECSSSGASQLGGPPLFANPALRNYGELIMSYPLDANGVESSGRIMTGTVRVRVRVR
ncbi:hypothetical protein T492DRAFT_1151299, partial [Pavlovales sp. CCMP2436]